MAEVSEQKAEGISARPDVHFTSKYKERVLPRFSPILSFLPPPIVMPKLSSTNKFKPATNARAPQAAVARTRPAARPVRDAPRLNREGRRSVRERSLTPEIDEDFDQDAATPPASDNSFEDAAEDAKLNRQAEIAASLAGNDATQAYVFYL